MDDLVAAIMHCAGIDLNIDAKAATIRQHPVTFLPNQVQVIDVFIAVIETNLISRSIVQLPIEGEVMISCTD